MEWVIVVLYSELFFDMFIDLSILETVSKYSLYAGS